MTRDIVVVGAGGFGREALDVIEAINRAAATPAWRIVGVVDDDSSPALRERLADRRTRYLGSVALVLESFEASAFVVGIGSPRIRSVLATRFEDAGWHPATLIHPSATVGSMVQIAPGSVICGGAQLSTNTRLGRHVHLNPAAIVGHDSQLGDFVSVNPGAVVSGEVVVEHGVLIGAGAVVLQRLTVGLGAVVGAAACVTKDVQPYSTVVGVPAVKRRGAR